MSGKILVTYATKYGSTREVAEAISKSLQEKGLIAELFPAKEVKSLEAFRAVVLGAPLYIGAWHKDARRFLTRFEQELTKLPVAVFALGPVSAEEKELQETQIQLDKELAKFPWLKPVAREMFAGKLDPASLRFPDNMMTKLPASPLYNATKQDFRDWQKISDWSEGLVAVL